MRPATRKTLKSVAVVGALALIAIGCLPVSELPGPNVYIVLGESDDLAPTNRPTVWTAKDLVWIQRGADQWRRVGFDVRPIGEPIDPELQPGEFVVIRMYRDAFLARDNVNGGLSDRTKLITFINKSLSEHQLMATVAHELGHQLLNTALHLDRTKRGVMTFGANSFSITNDDYIFSCDNAQRCDRY